MKVDKLLDLQALLEGRARPSDTYEGLNQHYSKSKGDYMDITDMDLCHLVRAHSNLLERFNRIKDQVNIEEAAE
jgi:hypothetical protein